MGNKRTLTQKKKNKKKQKQNKTKQKAYKYIKCGIRDHMTNEIKERSKQYVQLSKQAIITAPALTAIAIMWDFSPIDACLL